MFLAISSGTIASLAVAFSTYLGAVILLTPLAGKVIAIAVIAVITVVNVWGSRRSSDLQNYTTLIKLLLIIVISIILLLWAATTPRSPRHFGQSPPAPRSFPASVSR